MLSCSKTEVIVFGLAQELKKTDTTDAGDCLDTGSQLMLVTVWTLAHN